MTDAFVMAEAESLDPRWHSLADVVVYTVPTTDPVTLLRNTFLRLPGCALVAVALADQGCVLGRRDGTTAIVRGPVVVEQCAAQAYVELLGRAASLARRPSALGSSTAE